MVSGNDSNRRLVFLRPLDRTRKHRILSDKRRNDILLDLLWGRAFGYERLFAQI